MATLGLVVKCLPFLSPHLSPQPGAEVVSRAQLQSPMVAQGLKASSASLTE